MNKLVIYFLTIFLLINVNVHSAENRSLLEKLLNKDLPGGSAAKIKKNKDKIILEKDSNVKKVNVQCDNSKNRSLLEKVLRKDLPGGVGKIPGSNKRKAKCINSSRQVKLKKENSIRTNPNINNVSLYTGTFDVIDKEGDDQTTLFGVEHKNPDLFRDTFIGKFSPVSGAFMTGDSSLYLYTGVEGQYGIGPLKILPSFTPGYYEKGDGKDLGSVLEFKSEIKIGFDLFENSQLGYSYSHISNNDWGTKNPGTDNQQITFSKNF